MLRIKYNIWNTNKSISIELLIFSTFSSVFYMYNQTKLFCVYSYIISILISLFLLKKFPKKKSHKAIIYNTFTVNGSNTDQLICANCFSYQKTHQMCLAVLCIYILEFDCYFANTALKSKNNSR